MTPPEANTLIQRSDRRPMSKSEEAASREQRLAAKLRENLKRRKGQAKARAESEARAPEPQPAPEIDTVNKP
jgi:hypothetical protein